MENCEGAQDGPGTLKITGWEARSHGLPKPSGCANEKAAASNKRNMHNAKLCKTAKDTGLSHVHPMTLTYFDFQDPNRNTTFPSRQQHTTAEVQDERC